MTIHKSLIKGSLVLLIAFNIFNVLNFVFHFSMVRLLSVIDYGTLVTLFTITYILAVFSESIQIIITKYSAEEKDEGKLKNLLKKSFRKAVLVSVVVFFIYAISSIFLSDLLKINYSLLLLNGVIIFSIFFAPITRGVMQGKKMFKSLGTNMVIESAVKLSLSIIFVMIGWRVYGALIGTIIGMMFAIVISFFKLSNIMKSKESPAATEGIYSYSLQTFVVILVVLIFYNIDVIIAKIFFSSEVAGVYAVAAILSKTIFFGTQPISRAMFPITAEDEKNNGKPKRAFSNAFGLLFGIVVLSLIIFYFLPELVIKVYSGREIYDASKILFYLGASIGLVSFTNIILLYKLSVNRIKKAPTKIYFTIVISILITALAFWLFNVYKIESFLIAMKIFYIFLSVLTFYCFIKKYDIGFLFFLLVEIFLLTNFSDNLLQFSVAFIVSSAIFLIGSIFFTKN